MRRPALIPGILFALGILTAYYFKISSSSALFLATVSVLFWMVCLIKGKTIKHIHLLIIFLLAILYTNISLESNLSNYSSQDSRFTGTIHKSYEREDYSSYDIIINSINGKVIKEKVRTNLYETDPLIPGMTVYLVGDLVEPRPNTNPRLFDYRQYLLTKNIKHIIKADESTVQIIQNSQALGYKLQNSFRQRIDMVYDSSLSPENAGFMKALITGEKDSIQNEEYEIYKDMGIAHILAISGLHIGILSGFLLLIMSMSGLKRKISIPMTLVFIWTFSYLVGFPESALRASIMITLLMGSKLVHRPYDPINTLAVSFIASLMINPIWIFSLGFQLSYGATLSLATITPWIMERVYPAKGNLVRSIGAVAGVNLGILPLQSYYFNQLPVLALLSNFLVIPLATVNLVMGFVVILIPSVAPLLDLLLETQRLLINMLSKIPVRPLSVSSPEIYAVIIYVLMIFVVLRWRDIIFVSNRIRKVVFVFLLLVSMTGIMEVFTDPRTEIHFIDVGQGDSSLIKVDGNNYLVDTGGAIFGSYDPGKSVTLPYLKKLGIRHLDGVFISHYHEDHYKGIFSILDDIEIEALYVNGEILDDELHAVITEKAIPVFRMMQGSNIGFSDGSKIECIWPEISTYSFTNENNNSLVLMFNTAGKTTLFTGDIETEVERKLTGLSEYGVDVLKVAHHGSKTSSSASFVSKVSPQFSIISVGRNNSFGHPHDSVLETLEVNGSKIYRTDNSGLIRVLFEKDEIIAIPYEGPMYQEDFNGFIYDNSLSLSWTMIYYILAYILVSNYKKMEEHIHEIR
ncbi:DNA internalization-related competence protein ComEC/Rec2 [Gudongella sp. DL1XJH-153]|uniref:DNA internalization-related competence protein ComEC/Rec2 n=1 Tax=Gudongella sp. DL1XJH-153 TaxID=3409804 RepID=UPI003BB5A53F